MSDLDLILKKRRSVRSYLSKPVKESDLVALLESAQEAPVSCNLQVTKYIILNDVELLKLLSKKVSYKFSTAPAFILILSDSRFTVERRSSVVGSGMAAQNILLKAVDLGLSTCAMAGFSKDDVIKSILNIPKYMDIILLISVGYSSEIEPIFPVEKLNLDEIYSINNYGNLKTINPSPNSEDIQSVIDYRRRISTVYLSRFRLNSYNDDYYKQAFNFLKDKLLNNMTLNSRCLDLMSYDGVFLKKLVSNCPDLKIISSDYLKHNLEFFNKEFNLQTVVVDADNKLLVDESLSVDLITFVFQAEFTPSLGLLLKNASGSLKKDGYFFIALVEESKLKIIIKKIIKFYKKIFLRKEFNIYENNTFYKVGLSKRIRKQYLIDLFKKDNFENIECVSVKNNLFKNNLIFLLFKKK